MGDWRFGPRASAHSNLYTAAGSTDHKMIPDYARGLFRKASARQVGPGPESCANRGRWI